MTRRCDALKGVMVLPKRWLVKRTLGWFKRSGRLRKYDKLIPETSEVIIQLTMIHLITHALGRVASY